MLRIVKHERCVRIGFDQVLPSTVEEGLLASHLRKVPGLLGDAIGKGGIDQSVWKKPNHPMLCIGNNVL